jgi:hypothetical protein
MNILDAIVSAQNGATVRQAGSQVGLGEEQTAAALSALVPALAQGFQRNLQGGGLGSLGSALGSGNLQRYLEDPSALEDPAAVAEGNGILQQVLGSKDVSRQVASGAAAQTGISADVLKRLLPLAATMMMSALARRSGQAQPGAATAGGGLTDMLTPFLDRNKDGSIMDDVTGMMGQFLNRPK